MSLSYSVAEPDEKMNEVALEIVKLLINNNLTYQKATEALEAAQTLLGETRPSAF